MLISIAISVFMILIMLFVIIVYIIKQNINYSNYIMAHKDVGAYETMKWKSRSPKDVITSDKRNSRKEYNDIIMKDELEDEDIRKYGIAEI